MKTIAWILKHILLPLTPFILGAVARGIQQGYLGLSALGTSELGFSMAILCLVVSMNASRITNPDLKASIVGMYQLGLIIFLVLFAWAVYLEVEMNTSLKITYGVIEAKLLKQSTVTIADLSTTFHKNTNILGRLRLLVVIFSIIMIPLTILTNKKYDLEDL